MHIHLQLLAMLAGMVLGMLSCCELLVLLMNKDFLNNNSCQEKKKKILKKNAIIKNIDIQIAN